MADHATVWDRLYDPVTYTGVYSERFRDGPGINQDTDARVWKQRTSFEGYTNTATDEVIRDIADVTRPYLNPYPRERVVSPREHRISQVRERARRGESAEVAYPLDANTQLQLIFQYYCKFGRTGARGDSESTIDSFNFMRFARECPGLLDSRLDRAEVDLIFTKCRVKGQRRLEYREFLDALSAMAITKFPAEDPVTAFSLILSHHVFNCAPAVGLREARAMQARSRALREEAAAAAAAEAEEAEEAAASARSAMADFATGEPTTAYWAQEAAAHAAELRARAAAISQLSAGAPPGRAAPYASELHGPGESYRAPAAEGSARSDLRLAPRVGPAPALAPPPPSARAADAAKAMADADAETKASSPATPPRPEHAAGGVYGAAASFLSPTTASAIDQMRRVEDLAAERAAARARGAAEASYPAHHGSALGDGSALGARRVPPPALPSHRAHALHARALAVPAPDKAYFAGDAAPGHHHHHLGAGISAAAAAGRASRYDSAGWAATDAARSNPDDPAERLARDERFRGRLRHETPSYAIGSPQFRPTLAGQANRPGSVFDRLSNPTNFTGVYRRAYFTDGRMNAYADTGVSSIPSRFVGDTNTGTNETIHSISVTLRPGLRNGGGFR